jgi:CheY-like chemotaxis protein
MDQNQQQTPPASSPPPPSAPAVQKAHILVVEDDAFLREIYIDTLTRGGYNVDTAVDGDEGYDKIKKGGYDLILLDIILPKQEGLQIVRTLKEDPAWKPTAPIVFLTNLDNDGEIKQALQLGKGYLIKSQLTPADLLKEVGLYLAKMS